MGQMQLDRGQYRQQGRDRDKGQYTAVVRQEAILMIQKSKRLVVVDGGTCRRGRV